MSRAAWTMALAMLVGCEPTGGLITVDDAGGSGGAAPAGCVVVADCDPSIDTQCSSWTCVDGLCIAASTSVDGGQAACHPNGFDFCEGVCVYPSGDTAPGHCEGAASASTACGGDGTCDDSNPCTIDQGLAPGCLHYPVPGMVCEIGTCDVAGVCCASGCLSVTGKCRGTPPPGLDHCPPG